MKNIFLKLMFTILRKLHDLHNDLPFLHERMQIEKAKKFVPTLHDKKEYVIQIKNLKQALNYGLVLAKVHSVIELN